MCCNSDATIENIIAFVENAYEYSKNDPAFTNTSLDVNRFLYDEYALKLQEI